MKEEFIQTRFHSPDGHDLDSVWQILYPEHFINVLLIHHIKRRDEKNIEEVADIMRDGLMRYNESRSIRFMDPIYHQKFETFKIFDMFKPFKSEDGSIIIPKLILIDGAPGMGKTTLCKEIACQWAKGELLKDTQILFLLFLRDPAVQNMHDLTDFIQYFFKFKQSSLDLSKQCAKILEKRDNSDITILMDGYDELRNKGIDLLIERIIKRQILPQCRIVITSRPIASENLQRLAHVKVEVLGFNDKSKKEYIQKELKDYPEKAKCLISYLNNHSDINKICYIPIMMTIMVCTFKEYEELPINQSELYERFVTLVISRYLQKLDDTLPKNILSIKKLPARYQIYLEQLSEFAFKTIESDKIIFNNVDIENLSQSFALSSKELHGLGLFKATEQFSFRKMDNCVWYNFLHLSIHEYLAAYYIKSLEISEQFEIFSQKLFMKHYTNVWVMFIGLQHNVTHEFHQFLTYSHICGASDAAKDEMQSILQNLLFKIKNINIKNVIGTFKLLCFKNNNDKLQSDVIKKNFNEIYDSRCLFWFTYNWTRLHISLCSTTNSDPLIEVYLLDKNSHDISYHQAVTVLKQNQNLSVMLVSSDTLVGYRCNHHQLNNALHMNKSLEYVILRYCLISDDIARVLSSYLIKSNLKELHLGNNNLGPSVTVILRALKEVTQLKVLDLDDNNITGEVAEDLANVIKNNSNLRELGLRNTNLGPSATVILRALKVGIKLEVLILNDNNMTGEVAEDIGNFIKNNSYLKILGLGNNNLGPSATVILQALKENSRLKSLILDGNNMTREIVEDLANVIKNNSYLQQLGLENNNLGPSATVILQALKENSQLKVLNLNSNNMTGQVAEDLANVIKNNSGLEELHLYENDLKSSATVILQALKENYQLKVLNLNSNNMTGQVAEDLANAIKNNTSLEKLYLSQNDLRSSATVILQALKENSQLKVLNLNSNNMTGQVAEDLANAIKNNTNLEELYLSQNDLRSSATVILQALKENSQLKVLNLNSNNMTGQVAEDLANVIKNNSYLQQLGLENNNLGPSATVILQALKENSQLKVLNLNSNNMTGQVAEDLANVIKNNSGLEELHLYKNDLKSSATVILQALKENYQLKVLTLNNNNMTGQVAEDLANAIKNNTSLEKLYLSQNDLRSSATVILQALKENSQLKRLHLNNNNMTGKVAEDLANVVKNNCNLEQLCLENNNIGPSATVILQALKENSQLKVLNLGGNNMTGQVAEDLANVIKNNSGLEELHLYENDLKSSATVILQALKENSQLKVLNLGGNNMTGQVAEDLANVIKNNSGLEELHLYENDLKSSATVILQALKENYQLKVLNLGGNNMTGQVAEDLANVIKNNSGLEELHLYENDLKSSATVILQALKENYQLKVLNFNSNNMTGQVAEDLANAIKNNTSLEELYLSQNDLRSSATVILQALKENSQLKRLHLNNNNMTGKVAEDLANVVKNNCNLEQLCLENNNLGPSATVILQALKENSQLKVLNFNSNNMTGQVAEDLANAIKNNTSLEELYLSQNDLRSSATVILQALKENSQLKRLHLNNNNMTGKVAEDLANVVKNNCNLEQLCLENNNLGPSATVILQALKENSQLKVLNFNSNNMTGQVAEDLANAIKNNTSLEELYLSQNDLRSSITVILQALKENSQLKVLNLGGNNMTGQVAEDLANVIKNNPSFEELYLFQNDLRSSITVILQALKENSQLKVLNLNNNNMTGQVAEDLANVIKNNSGLEELYLREDDLKSSATLILQALKENSQLKVLNLGSNNMTGQVAEDLTNVIKSNSRLETLNLYKNDLRSSAVMILQALKENCELQKLNMLNNFLTETTTSQFVSIIKSNPLITEIWLDDNMLQSGLIDIAKSCNNLANLRALGLSHNSISPTEVVHLASVVSNIKSLQVVMFGGLILNVIERFHLDVFQIYNATEQTLMLHIQNNSFIVHEMLEIVCLEMWRSGFVDRINLNHGAKNSFPAVHMNYFVYMEPNLSTTLSMVKQSKQQLSELDAVSAIVTLTSCVKALKVLDLGYSNISKIAAAKLATALNCNNVLEQLWLRGNVLGADGAAVILTSLQNISTLRILDLSYNNISSTSANGIAAVINSNQFLEQLWLDGNMLMNTGVVTIASVLKKHSNLRLLSLSNNEITEDAAEEISAIVNSNTFLGGLLLCNNQMKSIGTCEIAKSLGALLDLQILELTNNCIDATAADELALMLSNCLCLRQLYLGNNNLETTGAIKVCRALQYIQILRVLSLNNNNITTEAASEICNVISTNTNLGILLLGGNDLQTTGVLQIANTVKNNILTMQLLSLSDNNINDQVKEDIKVMLCDECDLKLYV